MVKEIRTKAALEALSQAERRKVYLSESLTTIAAVEDNGEPLCVIEESKLLLSRPDEDCYLGIIKIREDVNLRLKAAASYIAEKSQHAYCLCVVDGFRPYAVQKKYFLEVKEEVRNRMGADATEDEIWHETTKWVADPDGLPPHSTGGAVDCTLYDAEKDRCLDMGSHWSGSDAQLHPTWSTAISIEARERRELLYTAMTKSGFVNLPTEWWHYSYGDQYWSLVMGHSSAIYGRVSESG